MARGKHAASAERRRQDAATAAEIETYRRQVSDLTATLSEERAQRAETEAAFREDIRVLKARLTAGAAPEVEMLNGKLRSALAGNERLKREKRGDTAAHERALERAVAALVRVGLVTGAAEGLTVILQGLALPGARHWERPEGQTVRSLPDIWADWEAEHGTEVSTSRGVV